MISKKEMLQDYLKSEHEFIEMLEKDYKATGSEVFKKDIELHEENLKNLTEMIEMVDNQLEVYATIICERNGIAVEHKVLTDGSRLFTEEEWEKECEARAQSHETFSKLRNTIRECIALLKIDGKNTKKIVLELLEEVIEK